MERSLLYAVNGIFFEGQFFFNFRKKCCMNIFIYHIMHYDETV